MNLIILFRFDEVINWPSFLLTVLITASNIQKQNTFLKSYRQTWDCEILVYSSKIVKIGLNRKTIFKLLLLRSFSFFLISDIRWLNRLNHMVEIYFKLNIYVRLFNINKRELFWPVCIWQLCLPIHLKENLTNKWTFWTVRSFTKWKLFSIWLCIFSCVIFWPMQNLK